MNHWAMERNARQRAFCFITVNDSWSTDGRPKPQPYCGLALALLRRRRPLECVFIKWFAVVRSCGGSGGGGGCGGGGGSGGCDDTFKMLFLKILCVWLDQSWCIIGVIKPTSMWYTHLMMWCQCIFWRDLTFVFSILSYSFILVWCTHFMSDGHQLGCNETHFNQDLNRNIWYDVRILRERYHDCMASRFHWAY